MDSGTELASFGNVSTSGRKRLSAEQIVANPALYGFIRQQAQTMLASFKADPRLGSVFATQQRWLMAHAALSLVFRRESPEHRAETTAARIFELVETYGIASRNTADTFLKELLHYNIIVHAPSSGDKRVRLLRPSESALIVLNNWIVAHLKTLDGLDGGQRCVTYWSNQSGLSRIQPLIADRLLSAPEVRQPEQTFSLFTWLNNGGVVMDWLFGGIDPADATADRIPTGVLSISDFADFLKLSRTHLDRKFREAERLGSLGWRGRRGRSMMWISRDFLEEYVTAQAVKLAIVDAAYDNCFGSPAPGMAERSSRV
ncbi:hypothetical protein [Mesorhizobium sp. DCY119]|uniref:hypothetical protein n=1 Tax=Mesorhizobium sp. DCY119 TaxID=2108445 RepID=UPI000E745C20|nr:hypothetical protein [Mesorhizobium sp. DCY119]RJG41576.1 hypothetical protein D3Y55_31030 [Mesorhizobium sp. DCY119]